MQVVFLPSDGVNLEDYKEKQHWAKVFNTVMLNYMRCILMRIRVRTQT